MLRMVQLWARHPPRRLGKERPMVWPFPFAAQSDCGCWRHWRPREQVQEVQALSSTSGLPEYLLPNNSLKPTRLAGGNAGAPSLPSFYRMKQ
jgi:hypothetical protein